MNLEIENWKLLILSISYTMFPISSYTIEKGRLLNFFRITGIVIILIGLFQALVYFSKKEYMEPNEINFSFGVLYCIVELIVATKPHLIIDSYPIVIPALVVLGATLCLQYSMDLLRLEDTQWKTHLALATVPLFMGVMLVLVPSEEKTLYNLFSFLLVLDAIANFYTILYYRGVTRRYGRHSEQILDTSNQEAIVYEVISGKDNIV